MNSRDRFGYMSFARSVWLLVLLSAASARAEEAKSLFPDFADGHTTALWLFDEPQYLNMTLTDAGVNMYDLRLMAGGQLEPGKFGSALRCSVQAGPAVELPYRSRTYDGSDMIVPDSRPVAEPEKLYSVLSKGDWTVECWLKLDHAPKQPATLLELGRGTTANFKLQIVSGQQPTFTLSGSNMGDGYSCPTNLDKLSDGQWHHVAFVKAGNQLQHYLDGQEQAAATTGVSNQPAATAEIPGLIGTIFDADSKKPYNVRTSGNIDFYYGEARDMAWGERWRGQLTDPTGGEVELWCQGTMDCSGGVDPLSTGPDAQRAAAEGVTVMLNGKTIIGDPGSAKPGYAKVTLSAGTAVPFQLDMRQSGTISRVRLLWRRGSEEWALVPSSAFSHTPENEQAVVDEATSVSAHRPYCTIGSGRWYHAPAEAALDEMRISDVARYDKDFSPVSFSRNHGPNPPQPAKPNGPPLLFAAELGPEPVQLGSRKHVFIDDVMIESRYRVWLKSNPPEAKEITDMRNGKSWENPSAAMFADCCVYDDNGQVRFVYLNNKMWMITDDPHTVNMAVSTDGVHFEKPNLGVVDWEGSRDNNIIIQAALQGRVFKDTNPNVPEEERYKFSAFHMQRGIYVFVSPDGIHWRRNETMMLPFDTGGGVEMCWDDQRGTYFSFMRHEGWAIFRPPFGRAAAMAASNDVLRPWPFTPQPKPGLVGKAWVLPSFTRELPTPFEPDPAWNKEPTAFIRTDHVYRTRAVKYEWAPDTYVAFVWRLNGLQPNETRQTELATSRDGVHWTFFGSDPYYFNAGWEVEGKKIKEALSVQGIIRRGDELWQYANVKGGAHVESSPTDRLVRYKQRLDGFTALNTYDRRGWLITRPFVFEGNRLELNADVKGGLRVALLDGEGNPIPGFLASESDVIKGDSVRHVVSWGGKTDVSKLSGKPVKLRIEVQNAKIFAFQFVGQEQGQ